MFAQWMLRKLYTSLHLVTVGMLFSLAINLSHAEPHQPGHFLTGPNSGDPLTIALDYLRSHRNELGLSHRDINTALLTDRFSSPNNGVTHIHLRQRYQNFEVHGANLNINIARDGSVISLNNSFIANIQQQVNTTLSGLSFGQAVSAAARGLGLDVSGPISRNPIPGKLVYQPVNRGEVRLAWDLEIYELDAQNWWRIRIDALTGNVLDKTNYVVHENHQNTMKVFPEPEESPNHSVSPGKPTLLAFTDLSPWVDDQCTSGNNVDAYIDDDASNVPTGGDNARACDPDRNFDFPLDLSQSPGSYRNAAITNLFYWNNLIHDVFLEYGFDEAGGNFQKQNYTQQQGDNDAVRAEAQDGGGINNANMATPPDGTPPRMQMYLWNTTSPYRDGDLDNGIIVHEYGHGISKRLTGGPNNTACLTNAEQGGEGWSDYFGLWMTMRAGDIGANRRGIGTYVLNQPTDGDGIRAFPYSTDMMEIDPRTYNTIKTASVPHGVGSVWAAMLWDMTWALIGQYGYDTDIYTGTGGNNIALQLVLDGLKMQPCSPGFVDARDAILAADMAAALANNRDDNQCLIWEAFAKRGLGYSADQGLITSRSDGSEAFDIPLECQTILRLTANGTASWADSGEVLRYQLNLYNQTGSDLTGVQLTNPIPANATFVGAGPGCDHSLANGSIIFNLGFMAVDTQRTCHFDVQVGDGAAGLLLADNMETGTGLWNVSHASGSVDWQLSGVNPHSPSSAWLAQDIATGSDQYLTLNNSISLGDDALLSFWHNYDTEANWDGGVVEISVNGSGWNDLGPEMFRNGYNSIINTNPASAISDRPAFSGSSDGYQQTLVDLGAYNDSNVRIRFRLATDAYVGGIGWDLDDVEISNNAVIFSQPCVTSFEGDDTCIQVLTPVAAAPAPGIALNPTAIAASHTSNTLSTHTLTISNTGNETLIWSIGSGCSQPNWVSTSPSSGPTAAGESDNVDVTFDSSNLAAGASYPGTLCISSNAAGSPHSVDLTLTVNDPSQTNEQLASGETSITGIVLAGNYTDTHVNDESYQHFGEIHQGGKPSSRWDRLEHIWHFNLQSGNDLVFNAAAQIAVSSNDSDDFLWSYSRDNSIWTPLYTQRPGSGLEQISVPLPTQNAGALYVRLNTTDQTPGQNNPDEIKVHFVAITEDGISNPLPGLNMYVNDLNGSSTPGRKNRWDAAAVATVWDDGYGTVDAAVVHGKWSTGETGNCTTNSSGQCTMLLKNIRNNVGSVTLQVTNVTRSSGDTYFEGSANSVDSVNIPAP